MKPHDVAQLQVTYHLDGDLGHDFTKSMAGGIAERDMAHDAIAEKGVVQRAFGAVEVLVGQYNVTGADTFTQAADRTDGHDEFDTQFFKAPDVGLVVDLGRQDAVSPGMAGKEINVNAAECAVNIGIGGVAEGSGQGDFINILEAFELIQTAAANDSEFHGSPISIMFSTLCSESEHPVKGW